MFQVHGKVIQLYVYTYIILGVGGSPSGSDGEESPAVQETCV